MTTLRSCICAVLVLISIAGCGGGGEIPLDNLGAEISDVSCAKLFDCCDAAEIMDAFDGIEIDGQPITTATQCAQFTSALFGAFLTQAYKESIAMGRIEYDGEAAADCMAAVDDLSCAEYSMDVSLSDAPQGCKPFIIPLVAEGGGCTQDYECTTDYCEGARIVPGEPSMDGMCKPKAALGQECRSDNCVDGAFCQLDLMMGKSICKPQKANDEPCSSDDECTSDLCSDDAQSPRTCVVPAPRCDGA